MPNVVLEAMASGLPCVAARASGSRELVVDGETGCLYEPDDADSLARAVGRCLGADGRGMGAEARRIAQERYAIDRIAERYEALYAGIVPERG
jgi:glycosyltransferase involved in cell wall biosynthesis